MLQSTFSQLGFTDNEVSLYLALAELGKASANLLSKRVQIPRTTAYSVLDSLVKKGVVSMEQRGATNFYSANNPDAILRLVRIEKEEVLSREALAEELVEQIRPYFKSQNFSVPKLQFFEGRANVESMLYDQLFEWQRSIKEYDSTWWGYQDHTFVEQYMEWLQFHWKHKFKDERIHLISNKAAIEQKLRKQIRNRVIHPVPEAFHLASSIWVVGDYIVLLMTRQKPHYAFQMRDAVFGASLRSVFQLLWASMNVREE